MTDAAIRLAWRAIAGVAAFSPDAATVEISTPDPNMSDGVQTATDGHAIPAGDIVALEPRGLHLLLRDIQTKLGVGDVIRIVLRFERAGAVTLPFRAHFN